MQREDPASELQNHGEWLLSLFWQCLKYGLIDRLVDDSELLNDSVSFAKEIISENINI